MVELVRRFHLGTSCRQAPFLLLRVLGATTCEPADELVPARRREEDEPCPWHGPTNLAGSGQVDLQERGASGIELVLDGTAGGAVTVHAVDECPLKHLAGLNEGVEVLCAHEVVVDAVDLTRAGLAGGG